MHKLSPLCLLTLSSLSAFGAPQFSPRQDIASGLQRLNGLISADFNGDGKLDFAVTSSLDKQVLVYLNKGDGTFGAPIVTSLQISDTTGNLVAGDFNEDGKQDLIVATISGPEQQDILLLGKGDGTFTQSAPLPGSFGFFNAVAVDINHDSHLDLVAGGNGMLYVHLGDGHGNFTLQSFSNQGASGAFFGLTAGDFNNDKKIDFVTAPYNFGNNSGIPSPLRFYSGNADGSFQAPSLLTSSSILSPELFASADFNGDGNLDLLVGEPNVAFILFGNGDGTFKLGRSDVSALPAPSGRNNVTASPLVATGDMDGDSKPDAVTADDASSTINVFINDGTGNFAQSPDFSAALDSGTGQLVLADLNGDGLPDLIVTNYITQKISIFLSIRPQVTPTVTLSSSAAQALIGTPLTFTAQVGSSIPAHTATGSVTLLDGSTTLAQQSLDATGKAAFAISNLAVGQHSLSVNYNGDLAYKAVSSTTVVQSITDFQPTLPTSAQTVSAGSTTTYTLTITPVTGLIGTATLSCSGLPSGYTCAAVTIPLNGQPTNGSISVATPARTSAQACDPFSRSVSVAFLGLPSLLLVQVLLRRRFKIVPSLAALLLAIACVVNITGCSDSSKKGGSNSSPVTTSFSITTSVTQAGQTVTHSIPATITVN